MTLLIRLFLYKQGCCATVTCFDVMFLPAVEHHQPSGWDLPAPSGHTWRQHHDANTDHITYRFECFTFSSFLWKVRCDHLVHMRSYPPPRFSPCCPSADETIIWIHCWQMHWISTYYKYPCSIKAFATSPGRLFNVDCSDRILISLVKDPFEFFFFFKLLLLSL